MFYLWIEMDELLDSKALWAEIVGFQINLTDLIDKSYLYGSCTIDEALAIISLCEKYAHPIAISLTPEPAS